MTEMSQHKASEQNLFEKRWRTSIGFFKNKIEISVKMFVRLSFWNYKNIRKVLEAALTFRNFHETEWMIIVTLTSLS